MPQPADPLTRLMVAVTAYGDAQYRAGLGANDGTDQREAEDQVETARSAVHQAALRLANAPRN